MKTLKDLQLQAGELVWENGDFVLVENESAVLQDIQEALKTDKGALFYAPDFGAGIGRFLHSPADSLTKVELKAFLLNALQNDKRITEDSAEVSVFYDGEIKNVSSNATPQTSCLMASLSFDIDGKTFTLSLSLGEELEIEEL